MFKLGFKIYTMIHKNIVCYTNASTVVQVIFIKLIMHVHIQEIVGDPSPIRYMVNL